MEQSKAPIQTPLQVKVEAKVSREAENGAKRISLAPMIDKTEPRFRFLIRKLSLTV